MKRKKLNVTEKNIIQWIVQKLIKIVDISNFRGFVTEMLRFKYMAGLDKVERRLDMNFTANQDSLTFLENYAFDNLETQTDAIGNSLRGELSRGILNGDSVAKLKQRVRETFKGKKFNERMKTVLRTEALRATETGKFEGIKQSNLKMKKYLKVTLDNRTSDICRAEHAKYGEESKAIPAEQDFVIEVNNKTIREKHSPFHPNCRTATVYLRVKE